MRNLKIKKTAYLLAVIMICFIANSYQMFGQIGHISEESGTLILDVSYTELTEIVNNVSTFDKEKFEIKNVEILRVGDNDMGFTPYLSFKWVSRVDDKYLLVAIELEEVEDKVQPLAPNAGKTTHGCSGVKCDKCAFVKENKKIVGCECNGNSSGYCNHTTTTTELDVLSLEWSYSRHEFLSFDYGAFREVVE